MNFIKPYKLFESISKPVNLVMKSWEQIMKDFRYI